MLVTLWEGTCTYFWTYDHAINKYIIFWSKGSLGQNEVDLKFNSQTFSLPISSHKFFIIMLALVHKKAMKA